MASISVYRAKDGTTSYRVRVRLKGQSLQTASFSTLRDAQKWAKMREGEMLAGRHFPERMSQKHTLSELTARYQDDIQPHKTPHNQRREGYILRYWSKTLGHYLLSEIQPRDIILSRDELSKTRTSGTLHRYLAVLSHMFTVAMKEYQWIEDNPCSRVSRPSLPQGRTRYLTNQERSRLLIACEESKNPYLYPLVLAALSTGMRQGELLGLRYQDIDLDRRVIHLELTKNKRRRAVPLVGIALDTIRAMSEGKSSAAYVFPAVNRHYPFNSYRKAWKYAVRNAGLAETFRFHDIRHAAASAMVQLGIPLYTVGTILGHTNPGTMTARYAHLATENLREALETMTNHLFPGRA